MVCEGGGSRFDWCEAGRRQAWSESTGRCRFDNAILRGAEFDRSALCGAKFMRADLTSCHAQAAVVDGATMLWECKVSRQTNFAGVGLEDIRIDPATKELLLYNIRRKNWERWYKEHSKLQSLARAFWWFSDYGRSTGRIVAVFFGLAGLFAIVYYLSAIVLPPGFTSSMLNGKEGSVPGWLVPFSCGLLLYRNDDHSWLWRYTCELPELLGACIAYPPSVARLCVVGSASDAIRRPVYRRWAGWGVRGREASGE